jgi:hypothetical protein
MMESSPVLSLAAVNSRTSLLSAAALNGLGHPTGPGERGPLSPLTGANGAPLGNEASQARAASTPPPSQLTRHTPN